MAAGVRVDEGIYDKIRPFRCPNSRHPRTGLHKRRLRSEELMGMSLERIRDLARQYIQIVQQTRSSTR